MLPLVGLISTLVSQCPPDGAAIVVLTGEHRMLLCESGAEKARYPVAIGSGGATAGRVGWAQTPLGRFTLSSPRPSSNFHTFIPLVNPNPKRFSAWAIGIHGPPRANKDDGASNVSSDWTWGCIAVATDAEIDAVAAWVTATRVKRVEFRD